MTKGVVNVAGDFHTANSTSYLVRTGKGTAASPYTWTTAVSFQNVEYAKATYTLVGYEDGDKANQALIDAYVAKYAYVTNTSADEVTSYNLVYFVNPAVNANLTVVGGEYYATLTGGVDMNGEAVALTVNVTKQCTDVDGKQLQSYKKQGETIEKWPFDNKFYLLMNIAYGGAWGASHGTDDSILPQQTVVDYVRVYEKVKP